jgi:DNA polymerase-3 subunit epsilon
MSATESGASEVIYSLDLETTGFNTTKDRIIEIALVKTASSSKPKIDTTDEKIEVFYRRVNPGVTVPAATTAIHHISDADLIDCPSFAQIAPDLLKFMAMGQNGAQQMYLVGHNLLRFDLPMLQSELLRAKQPLLDLSRIQCIDTLVIFRKQEPHTLSKAVEFYCGKQLHGAHAAKNDAIAALEVFKAQKQKYKQIIGLSNTQYSQYSNSSTSTAVRKRKQDITPTPL